MLSTLSHTFSDLSSSGLITTNELLVMVEETVIEGRPGRNRPKHSQGEYWW